MALQLDELQKVKLESALKDISISITRIEAERELQKEIKKEICEELNINKKVLEKLSRTYHKQNFPEEVQLHEEFEKLYESVST